MPSPLTHDDPVAFGAYRLIARLGSGGMGTVYLARSAGGRTVAVKTMHARIASDHAFRTRFRLEVDAARVIGGQFGAAVVDADPLAETPWLATEYVLGPPLDEAVELAGPLPEASVRVLGAALCTALGQLHRSDVVHRDLKPSNIMVTAYGPKVIDFGIARAIGDDRLTSTGAAVGTPAFMSPEQAIGQEHTSAGDVFALAGVLVFAATGQGPFGHGQPADLLYRVRYGDPDLTNVPPALAEILGRCLAKDPAQRPTTDRLAAELYDGGGEFADHLPAALLADVGRRATEVWQFAPARLPAPFDGTPETAVPVPNAGPSRRRLLLAGGGLAAVAAAGAGAWWWRGQQAGDDEPAEETARATRNLDSLWQRASGYDPMDLAPVQPHAVGDLVLLGVDACEAKGGGRKWQSRTGELSWQIAVEGRRAYRLAKWGAGDPETQTPPPLPVETIDLADGATKETVTRLSDVNSALGANQLLCVSDGVLYLAVGRGKYYYDGMLASQSWSLRAVDADTGRTLWRKDLPKRPDKSRRMHFLAAEVVGNRLVTLQETEEWKIRVVVRDVRTGQISWDKPYEVEAPGGLRSALATDGRHLYLGAGPLQCLRLSDGKQMWKTKSGSYYGPPTLKAGVLYAVAEGVGMSAVDAAGGDVTWSEKGDSEDHASVEWAPVIGTKYAYYKNGVVLRAIDIATHRTALTYTTTGDRFFAHERRKVIIAVDDDNAAAFPLR
ncbi:protein kinase [Streptomyces sp. NPDC057696]|uniref:serine/threonine-protein kinase n=1 Tax=Streptomyces sp. NPDC057696 TaxID=3346218 RepID=UPI0036C3EFFE